MINFESRSFVTRTSKTAEFIEIVVHHETTVYIIGFLVLDLKVEIVKEGEKHGRVINIVLATL